MKMKWVYYLIGANLVVLVVLISMMSMMSTQTPEEGLILPAPEEAPRIETRHAEPPEDVGSDEWCEAMVLMHHREWTDDELRAFSANCLYDLSE